MVSAVELGHFKIKLSVCPLCVRMAVPSSRTECPTLLSRGSFCPPCQRLSSVSVFRAAMSMTTVVSLPLRQTKKEQTHEIAHTITRSVSCCARTMRSMAGRNKNDHRSAISSGLWHIYPREVLTLLSTASVIEGVGRQTADSPVGRQLAYTDQASGTLQAAPVATASTRTTRTNRGV